MSPRGRSAPRRAADPSTGIGEGDRSDRPDPGHRRVFVAIPLPETARREITELVESVRSAADPDVRDVRWVRLDGLHLTLRFIGLVDESRLGSIAAAVEAAAANVDAFEATIEGGGAFPSTTRPRTLWLGVTAGADELAAAAATVEDALASAGFERSTRPYRAHLTLARSDGIRSGPDVARRLIQAGDGRATRFAATELVLFETIQGGGPARYEPLLTAPLRRSSTPSEPQRRMAPSVLPSEPSVKPRASVGVRRKEQRPGT
ncbi:MAG TPA: RNA 2',3'-cyclic phosphodiesterase [Candidatus Limnocylindrales bacterium]|nr:RNA 2',3'-cyclic phosphodiesterase [Candidatus Limnocylindrales bacterium]